MDLGDAVIDFDTVIDIDAGRDLATTTMQFWIWIRFGYNLQFENLYQNVDSMTAI